MWGRIGAAEGYIHTDCLTDTPLENLQLLYCVNNPCSTWAYLRSEPTTQSILLGEYNNGTYVRMLGETNEHWCYIQIGERSGYMMSDILSRQEEQTSQLTNIVSRASDGSYIHAYPAPNGQVLYFTALEEVNDVLHEDVNFDGQQNLVIITSQGASNEYCEFFVLSDGRYVMANHYGMEYGLLNYKLYPEKGIVSIYANNGNAGSLYEENLLRWEGTTLMRVRSAATSEKREKVWQEESYTQTTYTNELVLAVRDYTAGEPEGTIIYESVIDLNDMNSCAKEMKMEKL